MLRSERARLSQLNPHLICVLCGGYLIDATTIVRCLHTFCRTCIVHYLQSSHHCPVCAITVQKKNPFAELRPDKILQDIVYKVVPGLFRDEMNRRRECYMKNENENADNSTGRVNTNVTPPLNGERVIVSPEDKISLSLEFCPNGVLSESCDEPAVDEQMIENRYLLCPAAVSVGNLKKFLRMKFSLSDTYAVDMYYEDELLRDNYSLVDVAYISSWTGKEVLKLLYSIYENPAKRLKRAKSVESVRCNNDDSGIEDGNQSFESSPSMDSTLLNDSGQGLDCDVNKCDAEPKADDSVPCDTNSIMKEMKENGESAGGNQEPSCALVNGSLQTSCIVGEADALEAVAPIAEALFKDEEDDVVIEKLDETVSRIIAEGDNNDTEHSVQDVSGSMPCATVTQPQIQRRFSNASTETEPVTERRFSNASTETDHITHRRFSNASTETDDQICDLSLSKSVDKSESSTDSKINSSENTQTPTSTNGPNTTLIEHIQAQTQTSDTNPVVNQSTDFGMQTNLATPDKQCSDKGVQHNGCDSQNHVKNSNHVANSKNGSASGHVHESNLPCSGVCNGHSVKSRGPEKLVVKLSKEKDSESYTATSTIT